METGDNNMNQSTQANQAAPMHSTTPTAAPVATEEKNKLMGVLAYLGILVLIPYLMAKDNSFVKYHIKQGLVLVVISLAVWVVGEMVWGLRFVLSLVNLAVFILAIIGIVNVLKGKEEELPLVGQFSKHFTF